MNQREGLFSGLGVSDGGKLFVNVKVNVNESRPIS